MSDYTTESPASVAARQRRRRSLTTIGVVLLGLFFAFWYGLSYWRADEEARAGGDAAPTCRPYDPDERVPAQVTVNVYNATTRNGLAARTAGQLERQGFVIGKIANDPTDRKTPKVAEVRYGTAGTPDARLVKKVLPKGTKNVQLKRKGATVDVVLGTRFKALRPYVAPTGRLPMCPSPSSSTS
ncbi:LytR C-terminal domain-containing protein [Phycicoccus endophyticus]|uniref:LytR C-terminal domain-containing protein n=1 Tax=Phycicoccus endophyticus TaxID=1690220 RepID=A0A7G9R049_9MICO|nr:LytR C-terminal domain-containing protein [Phycicoccus endophyticus]QNN48974.1 LytR C-terminal domain-containing protein [Phycicoccus endophyticus]GGL45791.1 hypothetical protein GCM10012283_30530 [Phycicoccus endophyticus]